jgi:hypothetical protein
MATNNRGKADHLVQWQWSPGVSGNPKGRPKRQNELRWYLEGVMLNMPIAPEFYRNAMVICGMQKQIEQLDALVYSGAKLQDAKVQKVIPPVIKKLNYGEYGAMRACFEAAKNPDLFLKIVDQIHGKLTQAITATNPDGSPILPPDPNILVVEVSDDDEFT